MKTQAELLEELRKTKALLDVATASQQLIGTEGYRLLIAAVSEMIRAKGRRLMQMDCGPEETNAIRAEIRAYNWFSRWSQEKGDDVAHLAKRIEGLQQRAQHLHNHGIEPLSPEFRNVVTSAQELQAEVTKT